MGSTVFALRSHIPPNQFKNIIKNDKKFDNFESDDLFYKIIQPILDNGDLICFAGNIMHYGGKYNFNSDKDRIVLYGVLHLLDKNLPNNSYLETDKNINMAKKKKVFLVEENLLLKK